MYTNVAAESPQSCPTLCDPIDGSPPGSPVPGILQARTLEWVAISFSNACKWKVKVKSLSRVRLLATPWTVAHQAPLSVGFSRQEYWSRVPLPSLRWPVRHFLNLKFLPLLLLFFAGDKIRRKTQNATGRNNVIVQTFIDHLLILWLRFCDESPLTFISIYRTWILFTV